MRARAHGLFAAFALALLCSCHRAGDAGADRPGLIPAALVPSTTLPVSPDLVALGRNTYQKECLACHGQDGNGEGEAAYLLYPRPRDFTSGEFRLVSTWDDVPTGEDLFRTISRGMPGSAMPSWSHLPERTRWGLGLRLAHAALHLGVMKPQLIARHEGRRHRLVGPPLGLFEDHEVPEPQPERGSHLLGQRGPALPVHAEIGA
jgi:mono/diheme cytochrome c family protein